MDLNTLYIHGEKYVKLFIKHIKIENEFFKKRIDTLSKSHQEMYKILPIGLNILYGSIQENQKANLNEFEIMDIKSINLYQNKFNLFIDIACRYAGMGHYLILSMVKDSDKFFFREDGGSNGWEIEIIQKKYSEFNLGTDIKQHFIFNDIILHKLMSFDEVLEMMIQSRCNIV